MRTILGKRLFFLYPQKIFLEKVWRLKKRFYNAVFPIGNEKGKNRQ